MTSPSLITPAATIASPSACGCKFGARVPEFGVRLLEP
jgi:hypothetical protein